jgi:hypothetical protein
MVAHLKLPQVLLFAVILALGGSSVAAAQGFGWFGNLFGGGQPQESSQGYGRHGNEDAARRRQPRRHVRVEPAPAVPAKPKIAKAATIFVDVLGDTYAQLLASGLDDALSDKADVGVVHLGRGASGLVNDSFFNWPKAVDDLLAKGTQPKPKPGEASGKASPPTASDKAEVNRIDVAVVMIGSNDRQPFYVNGKKIELGTDEWTSLYRKRVTAIAEAFEKKHIPLIWVGLPIVKNDDFADDMAALNEIYRDVAERTGAIYVDTWEAFSDANGDFSAYGPDIDGQTQRLRTADGIYFTKAGARKLAHFVEGQIRRDIDGRTPLPQLPTAAAPAPDTKSNKGGLSPAAAQVKPDAGPIRNLGELPLSKDGRLGEASRPREVAPDVATLVKGEPEPAPVGRADNFRWPPNGTSP